MTGHTTAVCMLKIYLMTQKHKFQVNIPKSSIMECCHKWLDKSCQPENLNMWNFFLIQYVQTKK